MELPDVSRLSSLTRAGWASFGRRLRAIGLDEDTVAPFWTISNAGGGPLREPIVKWHLRRERRPQAYAMRMFIFWDPVTRDEARAVLGDELSLERVLEVGLLRKTDGDRVVSSFAMRVPCIGGATFVLADDLAAGGEAVMGPSGGSATLARFTCPLARIARGLDLGCGPGTLAMAMAPMCDRVVATDVSSRAIALARVNFWLNHIDNVELRTGDLFSPVAGESFDLVVSQPPFMPRPTDMPEAAFLYGGPRGDELPLRLLREIPTHLVNGGLALTTITWPIVGGDPALVERLRDNLGDSADLTLLLLVGALPDVGELSRTYGNLLHPNDDELRQRDVIRYREHFHQRQIREMVHSYTVVRRLPGAAGWTSSVPLEKLADAPASRHSIDALLAQGDRARAGESAATAMAPAASTG